MRGFIKLLCIFLFFGSPLFLQVSEVNAATAAAPKVVVVKGTIQKGKVPIAKGMVTTYSKGTNKAYHSMIKNGAFQLSVPAGDYTVHSYSDSIKKTGGNIYQNFTVVKGKAAPALKILLKEDNIKGSVQPYSGKITDGTIHFNKHDRGATNYFSIIRNNQFQLPLQDGKYTAYQYYDKSKKEYVQLDYTFTVSKGKLTSPLKMKGKPFNVKGSVQIPSQKKINGTMKIVCQSCTLPTTYTAAVKQGQYQASLPNGHFKVASVYNENTKKADKSSFVFEVKSEKVKAPSTSMKLVVSSDNQKGSIEKGGKPIAKGSLYIQPKRGEGFYYYPEINNGTFTTFLMDGAYEIYAYYDAIQQQIVPLEAPVSFVVSGGKSSLANISIQLQADNLMGTVKKAGKAIGKGTLYVQAQGFTRLVSIVNGKFTAYLADGTYTIQKARDEVAYLDYEIDPITVTVVGGKLSSSSALTIDILEDNVTGTFMTSSGVLGSGAFYVSDGSGKKYKFPIHNGVFSMFLPDGIYAIGDIFDYQGGTTKNVDFSFTVKGGKLLSGPLKIQIADANVKGTVTLEGALVNNGLLKITSAKGGVYYSAQVVKGQFSIQLPDGEYKVTEFEDYTTKQKKMLSIAFLVTEGKSAPLKISIPANNFSGTLVKSGATIKTGAISLYAGGGNYYTVSVMDNTYSELLPDGNYYVSSVYDQTNNVRYESGVTFSIVNGQLEKPVSIEVHEHNVKITVENSKKYVTGRLQIRDHSEKVYVLSVMEGRLATYLPDGEYKITAFYTESNLEIPLLIPFSVKDGKADQELIKIVIPEY
jgi:hypothetical protein